MCVLVCVGVCLMPCLSLQCAHWPGVGHRFFHMIWWSEPVALCSRLLCLCFRVQARVIYATPYIRYYRLTHYSSNMPRQDVCESLWPYVHTRHTSPLLSWTLLLHAVQTLSSQQQQPSPWSWQLPSVNDSLPVFITLWSVVQTAHNVYCKGLAYTKCMVLNLRRDTGKCLILEISVWNCCCRLQT